MIVEAELEKLFSEIEDYWCPERSPNPLQWEDLLILSRVVFNTKPFKKTRPAMEEPANNHE